MKLTTMLCVCFFCTLSAKVMSQERLSMQLGNVTIKEVFEEIRRQTDRIVFCNDDRLDLEKKVKANFKEMDLGAILERLLSGSGMTYRYVDDYILIVPARMETTDTVRQPLTLKGRVTDEKGNPLPGVTVLIKGTNLGVATDADGRFELMQPNDTAGELVFSFVGMKTVTVKWEKGKELNVVMKPESEEMAEVVVTGYGDVAKGNYTGAAYTVKAEEVLMAGASTIDQMLQGVIPGMLVMNQTGMVGATPKIRVRGTSTLLGSQEPVWVVDGVIQRDPQPFNSEENTKFSVDADDIKELAGNAISWLNPNDIESITVLKDASATAIYGSQAANGVIVITTKKAQVGRVQVSYSGDFSIGQRPRYGLYDLMNSAERMQVSKEIFEEKRKFPTSSPALPIGFEGLLEQYLSKEISFEEMREEYQKMAQQNTDWFDILFRNSFNHSHNLSISGGSENVQNRSSFSFVQENGEAKGNDLWQFTASSNTTVMLWKQVTLNLLLNGSIRETNGFAYGVDPFEYAYNTSRVIPAYNEDGSLYFYEKRGVASNAISGKSTYAYNILNEEATTGSKSKTRSWGTTVDLRWQIIPGLEYQGLFAYQASSTDVKQFATERSFYITEIRGYEYGSVDVSDEATEASSLPMGGVLETGLTNVSTVTVRNALVFDRLFNDRHRVTLQLGIETNSVKTEGETNVRYGYMPDRGESFVAPPSSYIIPTLMNLEMDNVTYAQGSHTVLNRVENKLSEYGSAVYIYDERYVLNLSARMDASNRFGQDKNKRFQPTWSVGLKWRLANEKFANNLWWLNNFDVYGSYGYQGNAVSTVSPELIAHDVYEMLYGLYSLEIVSLPYPDLGWEKTRTWNVGVDASLLNGRMNFTFNYFRKKSNVLASRDIPYENGMGNGVASGSTMKNYGYDFVINVVPIRSNDFTWQLSLNTGVTRNSIEKNDRINTLDDYLNGACVVKGRPFSTFYSYEFDGLEQEHGQPMFKHLDVENAETPADYLVECGKFTPDFSGGLNTMFKYKNWSLYALFAIQWGGHGRLPNLFNEVAGPPSPEYNVSTLLKDRWKQPGDKSMVPGLPGRGEEYLTLPATLTTTSYLSRPYDMYNVSNVRVANTDFIRCRSLSLAYDFNQELLRHIGVSYLQMKVSMTNPFMWVSDDAWNGLDPETGDWPARRVTSLSIQVMF